MDIWVVACFVLGIGVTILVGSFLAAFNKDDDDHLL